MKKELIFKTFRNITGAAVYVFFVSQIMQNGDKLFGKSDNMFTPLAVILLFSFSAAVMGGLVFGQSVILFMKNKTAESITAGIYSIGWLGFYTLLGFVLLAAVK